MKNRFDESLEKALTAYEREIVEEAEKNSAKTNTITKKNNFKKYISIAILFIILIPSMYIGSNIYNNKNSTNISENALEKDSAVYDEEHMMKEAADSPYYIDSLNINTETLDFNNTIKETEKLIEKYKAIIENQNINNLKTGNAGRYANYSIKILDKESNTFIDDIEKLNINIINTDKFSYNVTDEVENLQNNLENTNIKLERLQELLKEASTIAEITEIEGKIQEAQTEKNNYEDNMKSLGKEIDYTTINISITEVSKYSGTENINEGFTKRIGKAFENSKIFFIRTVQNTILGFITLLPFIVFIAIVVGIVFIIRKRRK